MAARQDGQAVWRLRCSVCSLAFSLVKPGGKWCLDMTQRLGLSSVGTERIRGLDFRHHATLGRGWESLLGIPGEPLRRIHMWGVLMARIRYVAPSSP
jgi:hypothetical protein